MTFKKLALAVTLGAGAIAVFQTNRRAYLSRKLVHQMPDGYFKDYFMEQPENMLSLPGRKLADAVYSDERRKLYTI